MLPRWKRAAHPGCFSEIARDVREQGEAVVLALIEKTEAENGWTDTVVA